VCDAHQTRGVSQKLCLKESKARTTSLKPTQHGGLSGQHWLFLVQIAPFLNPVHSCYQATALLSIAGR
jgi:hypothetical protein